MDRIVPVSELRATLSSVTKWVEKEKQPVILTKNGRGRFVLLDIDTYNELVADAADNAAETPMHRPASESGYAENTSDAAEAQAAGLGATATRRLDAKPQTQQAPRAETPLSRAVAAATAAQQPADAKVEEGAGDAPMQQKLDIPELSPSLAEEEERIMRELGLL